MKKCPYCAEMIQDEAIVCRYCGRDLPTMVNPQSRINTSNDTPIYKFWLLIIQKPIPSTFQYIAESKNITLPKILFPVFILTYINSCFELYGIVVKNGAEPGSFAIILFSFLSLFLATSDIIIMFIGFAITHGIAKIFSAKNTYRQLAFTLGSAYAVYLMLSILIALVSQLLSIDLSGGGLGALLSLLFFVINILIVVGVGRIRWWQSLIAVIPGFLFTIIVMGLVLLIILTLPG